MQSYRNRWIVVCDFDGTISTVDATDRLLEVYADPEWLSIEQDWKDGNIGSRECLSRQVALLRADLSQIEALADTITIDPHFTSFADLCKRECIELVIISDGLDRVIARILDRHGLGHIPVYANALLACGGGAHRMLSPHQNADCCAGAGTCKCAVVADLQGDGAIDPRVLFVGDGQSDFCAAARMADVVAAKPKLLAHLRSIGRPCVPFENFADVRRLLAELIDAGNPLVTEELAHECN